MRFRVVLRTDIRQEFKEEFTSIARGIRRGTEDATDAVQAMLRAQVQAAGLGTGLSKAWRKEVYPKGNQETLHPAGLVYSNATFLHQAFTQDREIVPRRGRYLVIALPAAQAMGFGESKMGRDGDAVRAGQSRKVSQLEKALQRLGEKNFTFARLSNGRFLVLYNSPKRRDRRYTKSTGVGGYRVLRGQSVPMFLLLRHVTVKRRLDLDAVANQAGEILRSRVAAAIARG